MAMGVFKKQGVFWIDYYVTGRRKRERIGPDKRLAKTALRKRKVEIAEGKWLDKRRPITTTAFVEKWRCLRRRKVSSVLYREAPL
jgi:hypothetical protein